MAHYPEVLRRSPRDGLRHGQLNQRRQQRFRFCSCGGVHPRRISKVAAAKGKDVRLGGGVSTVRQYLQAGLVDDLHLVTRPILMGRGENLLRDLDLKSLGYECTHSVPGERATHVYLARRA